MTIVQIPSFPENKRCFMYLSCITKIINFSRDVDNANLYNPIK